MCWENTYGLKISSVSSVEACYLKHSIRSKTFIELQICMQYVSCLQYLLVILRFPWFVDLFADPRDESGPRTLLSHHKCSTTDKLTCGSGLN